jgi:tetratricopeptide (TPR) repeat protein
MCMTFPRFSPSPNSFVKAALLLLSLTACSASLRSGDAIVTPSNAMSDTAREKSLRNQYEWGVQYYESGKYLEAIKQFQKLKADGAEIPAFVMVPFYLGMANFQLNNYPVAESYLRDFLKSETPSSESQDARIALITMMERLKKWDELLGLAAETENLTLFQDNRAFLKLLWAQALEAKGELKGAKAVLTDAEQFLGGEPAASARTANQDRDLWGRYHYITLLLELDACRLNAPKEIGSKKSRRRLYAPWLDASVDCLRKALALARTELFARESIWSEPSGQALRQGVDLLGNRAKEFLRAETTNLPAKRALEAAARSSLYRLMGSFDDAIQSLQSQNLAAPTLKDTRKQIDLLLSSLSAPN